MNGKKAERLTWKAVVLVAVMLGAGASLTIFGHSETGGLVVAAAAAIALGLFGFNIKQGGRPTR